MKKKYLFLCLAVLLFNGVYAQDEVVTSVRKHQFKINMFTPGFVYEHGFDTKNTLYSELSLNIGYRHNDFYDESSWYFVPTINEQFRHYYNLEKRAAKGKRTAYNSGNFFAASVSYNFESISSNSWFNEYSPSVTIGPLWGFQRTYKRKFNLELGLGAGVNIDKYDTEFTPIINFTLGWVIGK
ncbi:hypothetical protein C8C83_3745 [Flavobacterium sp. 90]|uniref:hypothetical protein n=1 Tax=unclassified Flavobacterium TaxID=196869 RepID=UPI000EACF915|nr:MULTISPECIES: hypothetical protein [unclassified Flavobacterium]RKR11985.1 hypothetical protein C8C82_4065 [Flavobacterium sp. 81]TCK55757.1 hypothetical protein C8C83_3745 [Flavobacterium sp. 90]